MNSEYFNTLSEDAKKINPFSDDQFEEHPDEVITELTIIKRNTKEIQEDKEDNFKVTEVQLEKTDLDYNHLLKNVIDKKITVIVCDSFYQFQATHRLYFVDPFYIVNNIEEANKFKATMLNTVDIVVLKPEVKTSSTPRHIKGHPANILSNEKDEYLNIFMERFSYKQMEAHKAGISIKYAEDLVTAQTVTKQRLENDANLWIGDLIKYAKEGKSLRLCSWFFSKKKANEFGYESTSEMPNYLDIIIDKINELT